MPVGFILFFSWIAAAAPALAAETLYLKTENSPPATIVVQGRITGRLVDKVTAVMQRLGIKHELEVLPWQRAYHAATTHPATCIFPTTRSAEREARFHWVGPLATIDWTLYGLHERKLNIRTLEDARPYLIGTYLGDARDTYLRGQGLRVAPVADDRNNAGKLLARRIDLWAASKALAMTQQSELDARIVPVLVFHKVDLYLACNLAVPAGRIKQMSAALAKLQRDGSIRAIEQRYARWPKP